MPSMCDDCKCSTYYDEEKDSFHCDNECLCCNGTNILEVLQTRNEQVIALTDEVRQELEEAEDMGISNPILFAVPSIVIGSPVLSHSKSAKRRSESAGLLVL